MYPKCICMALKGVRASIVSTENIRASKIKTKRCEIEKENIVENLSKRIFIE